MKLILFMLFFLAPSLALPFFYKTDKDSVSFKIGQLIISGFRGLDISDSPQTIRDIKNGYIGGVILFDYDVPSKSYQRNIRSKQQLTHLIRQLKSLGGKSLFVSIDQEGGKVNRLKPVYGFPKFVSADSIGRSNSSFAKLQAELVAQTLKSLGINLNFAPVVDINLNPNNPIIGKIGRSFSSHADRVFASARIFADSFRDENILFTLKHFPGHGSSKKDSHKGFVDVTDTWQPIELLPYKQFIKANKCDIIMIAHVFNKNLDETLPSSLSKKVVTDLLRKKLSYQGVIATDDIQMKAITNYYSLDKALELALNAGVDLIILGNNSDIYDPDLAKRAHTSILKLVNKKRVSKKRIDESFKRVWRLKKRLLYP